MKTNRKYITTVMWLLLLSSASYADGNKLLEQCLAAERSLDSTEVSDDPLGHGNVPWVCTRS